MKKIIRPIINKGCLNERKIIGQYQNGNYTVYFMDDGTKIRYTNDDKFVAVFPENIDLCITKSCSVGCQFCYANCVPNGKHWEYSGKIKELLSTLHPFTELAINGNDWDIPALTNFLSDMKAQNVFVNATFHLEQLYRRYNDIRYAQDMGQIHGIGVSINKLYTKQYLDFLPKVKNCVVHVIAGIFDEEIFESLKNKSLKILILGYKNIGRGKLYDSLYSQKVKDNLEWLEKNIDTVMKGFEVCSFDNLALEQLKIQGKISPDKWETNYMGDDGQFTMYIDAVDKVYAKNSIEVDNPMKCYSIECAQPDIDVLFNVLKCHNKV